MNLFKLPLTVTYEEVLPFLGIRQEASPQEQNLINNYLQEIRKIARPVGLWQTFTVAAWEPTKIVLQNSPLLLEGTTIAEHFKSCAYVTLLATTLGSEVDSCLTKLTQANPAHAFIFDGVASAAAESFTEQLDSYLSREINHKGFYPTARYSPGYGDWALHWQKVFLTSIGSEKIGLTVTPHFLLQPLKSVTAALGWSNIPVTRSYAPSTPPASTTTPSTTTHPPKPCRSPHTCPDCTLRFSCPDKMET